ncbi:sensor histidine kinase [Sporolactobacillus vineae]|uniref:sensor histidine kinase n=1 Tax=Sporolactobacillus vineae TaxID=444463 RepID=UPI000287F448|nr:HAMP domain-containing sensor histidine kinase [Sporolactobacillus vineae]
MRVIKIFFFMAAVLTVLSIFWTFFYFVIGLVAEIGSFSLNPLAHHIISSILGIFLFAVIGDLISHLHKPKRLNYFQAIIQALRQIAKGNFEIELDASLTPPGLNVKSNPFIQLADSVHYMAKELSQIERVRQEFISNVSHEIQSPLTSIKGFAKALESDGLSDEERRHYIRIIESESDRLSKLSDNLLKLTVLENNRHPIRFEAYRADRQIRQVLLTLEPQWNRKKLDMRIKLEAVTLIADQELMNQVWMNLIQNSIKFTPEQGRITIRLFRQKNGTVFQVSDTGIGIREEDRIHLFERFYKADKSRNRTNGGNGLGLSIVKKIVDVHHGSIRIASEPGQGTQFTVSLPVLSESGNEPAIGK